MAVLHGLGIVHCDIKPENVMLSPHFKKAVFVDFGLSKLIGEKRGEKSRTMFVGTINFCSDEMGNLAFQEVSKRIDLYYNDLHALSSSLKSMRGLHWFISDEDDLQACPDVSSQPTEKVYLAIYQVKFYLFRQQISEFSSFWDRHDQ